MRLADTPDAFLDFLLQSMIQRFGQAEQDNVDMAYPPDGVTDEAAVYVEKRAAFLRFVTEHYARLFGTYAQLADEASRALFVDLILFRILGHEHVRLPSNRPAFWAAKQDVLLLEAGPSQVPGLPGAARLNHFELPVAGQILQVDCYRANLLFSFFLRQYYLERDDVLVRPERGDHVIDAGACFGDTALNFARSVGVEGRVHAFEVLEAHLGIIGHNMRQNPAVANVVVHPVALSDADRAGSIVPGSIDPGFSILRAEAAVPTRTVDSLLAEGRIERVDFIKMDIEGHELPALRGAENAIRRFRPKLAISLYHRPDDYFRIPEYIRNLDMNYRMYLENYTISDGETVLYCLASDAPPSGGPVISR